MLSDGLGGLGRALVEATREKRKMSRTYYLEQMKEAKEIEKLKAEHARYREALERISDFNCENARWRDVKVPCGECASCIAGAALENA